MKLDELAEEIAHTGADLVLMSPEHYAGLIEETVKGLGIATEAKLATKPAYGEIAKVAGARVLLCDIDSITFAKTNQETLAEHKRVKHWHKEAIRAYKKMGEELSILCDLEVSGAPPSNIDVPLTFSRCGSTMYARRDLFSLEEFEAFVRRAKLDEKMSREMAGADALVLPHAVYECLRKDALQASVAGPDVSVVAGVRIVGHGSACTPYFARRLKDQWIPYRCEE